jgi:hypothetical protein
LRTTTTSPVNFASRSAPSNELVFIIESFLVAFLRRQQEDHVVSHTPAEWAREQIGGIKERFPISIKAKVVGVRITGLQRWPYGLFSKWCKITSMASKMVFIRQVIWPQAGRPSQSYQQIHFGKSSAAL